MEIQFTKANEVYVAEFTALSSFNLHIERPENSALKMEQKTSGGEYAFVMALSPERVHDIDVTGVIFPKQIRLISTCPVNLAIVTF